MFAARHFPMKAGSSEASVLSEGLLEVEITMKYVTPAPFLVLKRLSIIHRVLKAQNMCKELICGVLDNSCLIYQPRNRDRLEQGRKVTDTHRNPQTRVCTSKNSLQCLQSLNEKPLQLWRKLDIVVNNLTGSHNLKSTTKGGVRWPRAPSLPSDFSYLRTVPVDLLKTVNFPTALGGFL